MIVPATAKRLRAIKDQYSRIVTETGSSEFILYSTRIKNPKTFAAKTAANETMIQSPSSMWLSH
jgi:hypothetical protein